MREVKLEDIELAVRTMANVAIANEKYFSELDSVAGDADFGVSLSQGFKAVLEKWDTYDRSSIGSFLGKVGVVITSSVGGCSGPIWGTWFMRAGSVARGKQTLGLADLVAMQRSAIEGMMARGGAKLGDKTLLDAVSSATDKLEEWSRKPPHEQDIVEAFQEAANVATGTIESTRGWVAQKGRQSYLGDRSKGTVDPGIVAVATMLQAVARAAREAKK